MGGERARLLSVLAAVPDLRARHGGRHRLAVIWRLAVCAVLAGARSFMAIAEWAADADQDTLDALGVTGVVPVRVHVPGGPCSTWTRMLSMMRPAPGPSSAPPRLLARGG